MKYLRRGAGAARAFLLAGLLGAAGPTPTSAPTPAPAHVPAQKPHPALTAQPPARPATAAMDAQSETRKPAAGKAAASSARTPATGPLANAGVPLHVTFTPPAESAIPKGKFGDMVKLGRDIFLHTGHYAGKYVGNALSCSNCHLDAGRMAGSAPLWAAYVSFPAYRSKSGKVNTFEQRLQGCFRFSENGQAPPLGGKTLIALQSYAFWMASGLATNSKPAGRGYPSIPAPPYPPSYDRGKAVFAGHCAMCHGANGQGRAVNGETVFPPLWGDRSYNWGAGMAVYSNAAKFIRANMPLGLSYSLTPQQAWDVAFFIDAQERPQDPRWLGSVDATRKRFHVNRFSLYGAMIGGHRLGDTGAPKRH